MILGIMNTVQFYEEQCNFQYMQREISVKFITAVHLYIHYVLCACMFQCVVYIQYRTLFLVHCELQRNYWRRIQAGRRHCTPAGVSVLLLQQYTVHLLVLVTSVLCQQYTVQVHCTSTLFTCWCQCTVLAHYSRPADAAQAHHLYAHQLITTNHSYLRRRRHHHHHHHRDNHHRQ